MKTIKASVAVVGDFELIINDLKVKAVYIWILD